MMRYLPALLLIGFVHTSVAVSPSALPARMASFGSAVVLDDATLFVSETSGFHTPGLVHIVRQQHSERWAIEQSLSASDAAFGDRFGTAIASSGDLLAVGAPNAADGLGRVYVFLRDADGRYSEQAVIPSPSADPTRGFGSAVAIAGRAILVGTPSAARLDAFVLDSGDWVAVASLTGRAGFGASISVDQNRVAVAAADGDEPGSINTYDWTGTVLQDIGVITYKGEGSDRFGSDLAISGDVLAVGAAGTGGSGAVHVYQRTPEGWSLVRTEVAPDALGERSRFGSHVQWDDSSLWVGAPSALEGGALVRYHPDAIEVITEGTVAGRASFGTGFAASGDFLAVGASGDAYGEGTAFLYRRQDGHGWRNTDTLFNEIAAVPAISGTEVECRDGSAGAYACNGVDLLAFLPNEDMEINRGVRLNDVWGWTDPETGREYALVGHMEAMTVVEISDPTGPRYLGTLPRTPGSPGSTWRDIKVYRDHAFIVADGAGEHGMQVFDLRQLRTLTDVPVAFEPTTLYTGIASAHNIVINEDTGFAYAVGNGAGGETCGGGLHMIDIRDPANPEFAGCFTHEGTNNSGGGSTHDAQCVTYRGPDAEHRGREICISANGAALSVSDVTDKEHPEPIAQASYPNYSYVHQGWFTDDHRYFYQNDEGDEISGLVDRTRTLIWDMTDLDDPQMIGEFFGPTNATDHNLYVDGNLMYQTNNASGLRIVDISNPESPVEIGHFDTTPYGTDAAGFNGTWSSYPYFGSGTLVVTSRREGLFLVRKQNIDT